MAFRLIAATAAIAGFASAQPVLPKPCVYPLQFTAQMQVYNYAKNILERATVAYDGQNERIYERETYRTVDNPRNPVAYELIYDYRDELIYKTNIVTRECVITHIPANKQFHRFGLPKNATYYGSVTNGVYPDTIDIHQFRLMGVRNINGGHQNALYHVTANECMPTQTISMYFTPTGLPDLENSETVNFYDTVLGISDPNVFIPPANCKALDESKK